METSAIKLPFETGEYLITWQVPDRRGGHRAIPGLLTVEQGAMTEIYCATSPELTLKDSACYFIPIARKGHAYRREAFDANLSQQVWAYAEACMREANAAAEN